MTNPSVESVITDRRNGWLIAMAARLWIRPDDLVVDVTYGEGGFWTHCRPRHLIAHDLYKGDGVDFRSLPEADGSVDVVVFDPAYVPPGGRETSTIKDMHDRYGMAQTPKTVEENAALIAAGIKEAGRVLRPAKSNVDGITQAGPGGRLIAKTMDFIWSGKLQQGRRWVEDAAAEAGLRKVDEFVHVSGTGPQPKVNLDGTPRRQVHSRRSHSFLEVFQRGTT